MYKSLPTLLTPIPSIYMNTVITALDLFLNRLKEHNYGKTLQASAHSACQNAS